MEGAIVEDPVGVLEPGPGDSLHPEPALAVLVVVDAFFEAKGDVPPARASHRRLDIDELHPPARVRQAPKEPDAHRGDEGEAGQLTWA